MLRNDATALEEALGVVRGYKPGAYPRQYWFVVGLMTIIALPGITWPLKRLVTLGVQYWMLYLFAAGLLGTILIFAGILLGLRHISAPRWPS